MSPKRLLMVGAVLVVAAFLLGFTPQYLKRKDLENQIGAARQQLDSELENSRMDELGLLCGYVYLETNLKNYGLASKYSTQFFDQAQIMAGQASDANRRAFLQAALGKRDSVTGGLAKGDPGIAPVVQDLFQSTLAATLTKAK